MMSASALQRAASSLSSLPQHSLSHSSRDIRYIFLDGCKNIAASHTLGDAGTHEVYQGSASCQAKMKHSSSTASDCCLSLPKYLPTSFTSPMHLEKQAMGSGHVLTSQRRLPVFQQLCQEAVPGMALGDVPFQSSSHELKELPGAKAQREDTTSWAMRLAPGCSPYNKA